MRRIIVFIAVLLCGSALTFSQVTKPPATAPQQKSGVQSSPSQPAQQAPAPKPAASPAKPAAPPKPSAADLALEQKVKEEAAAARAAAEKQKNAKDLIHEWFIRWNALSENTPEAINRFLEMYNPDAVFEVGPGQKQAGGPVAYRGEKLIRKMVEDYAKKWNDVDYAIVVRTEDAKSSELISTSDLPWGNTQLAVEYLGGQLDRATKKRYMIHGAGFFEFENGKITRARLYMPTEETVEVTGPFKVM